MFTGIVQGLGEVVGVADAHALRRLEVLLPAGADGGLEPGCSIAVDGVCLTLVQAVEGARGVVARFDVIDETLRRTTLGGLLPGHRVDVERSVRLGDELGGHVVSGHVDGVGVVAERHQAEGNLAVVVRPPAALRPYLLERGFVAVAGVSLTVGTVDERGFHLHLIPETRRRTVLGAVVEGSLVNLEVDATTRAVVATVERVLASRGLA